MDLTGVGAVADLVSGVINRIWPDASEAERGKLTLALAQLNAEMESARGQMAVNSAEAASGNAFVAGWRPFVGWVCGLGLLYQLLLRPLLMGFSGQVFPALEIETLMTLLFGVLGLGWFRSSEKIKGVARR